MEIPLYQVDAFTNEVFRGNPAAVCPLEYWLDDTLLQGIAAKNNLSETAFFVPRSPGQYDLRWFTPAMEVDLCGHTRRPGDRLGPLHPYSLLGRASGQKQATRKAGFQTGRGAFL